MAKLKFVELKFRELKDRIRINFFNWYFELSKDELYKIGKFRVTDDSINFPELSEPKARKKFSRLIDRGFTTLKNQINNRKTAYITESSGIPLFGGQYFGIIDRNTNLLEIRTVTGCNLDCIYCSVDEGGNKEVDFLVEKDYIVKELVKCIKDKKCDDIEVHINSQGEPLLYPWTIELIKDISAIKDVKRISLDTNGLLLSKDKVKNLEKAGLTQLNLSLNALDQEIANKIAGRPYNISHIMDIIRAIKSTRITLMLAPIWLKSINDREIEKIILLSKDLGAKIGIQNFLPYKRGKRLAIGVSMEEFFEKLRAMEEKYNIQLILEAEKDFSITKTSKIKPVFKKGEYITAKIVCPGRRRNEQLGVARDRLIAISGCIKTQGMVKAKITRIKHNIYYAVCN